MTDPLPDTDDHLVEGNHVGPYRIVRELGQGGMSIVYEAVHEAIQQRVAIKYLRAHSSGRFSHRLLREARALARSDHPGLVKILGSLELPDGRACLVLELLQGTSLRDRLGRPLPIDDVIDLGRQLSVALVHAHAHAIVHRDLKPENIMLVGEGELKVKILDFGIAKLLDKDELATQTQDQRRVLGTPKYMSPEQCIGDSAITAKSDVYSLGVILFELLAGRPPFLGDTEQLLLLHPYQSPPLLLKLRRDVPPALVRLVSRMLAKRPAARPSMQEVADALKRPDIRAGTPIASYAGKMLGWSFVIGALTAGALARHHVPAGMALVPSATFWMGSTEIQIEAAVRQALARPKSDPKQRELYEREQPRRQVTVTGFWMDQREISNEQFAGWLNGLAARGRLCTAYEKRPSGLIRTYVHLSEPSRRESCPESEPLLMDLMDEFSYDGLLFDRQSGRFAPKPGNEQKPIVMVTWRGARMYCDAQGKRLPTEAEFELAARGTDNREYPWGSGRPECNGVVFSGLDPLHPASSLGLCKADTRNARVVDFAGQDRSPYGILNLAGNVSEWALDAYEPRYRPCPLAGCVDPAVIIDDDEIAHSVRGGTWTLPDEDIRAAVRGPNPIRPKASLAKNDLGFRCVKKLRPWERWLQPLLIRLSPR